MAKIMDRLLLLIYSLIVFVLSIAAICVVARIMPKREVTDWIGEMYGSQLLQGIVLGTAIVLLLISLRFLYVALKRGNASAPSIDQRTSFGDIRISLETVENLALKAASKERGVKDLKARIRIAESGIDIALRTVVDGESVIPTMTED